MNNFSNGKLSDFLTHVISRAKPKYKYSKCIGVLGEFTNEKEKVAAIINKLREEGYYKFETKIPKDVCKRIYDYALHTPCQIGREEDSKEFTYYEERAKPRAVTYNFDVQTIFENKDMQDIVTDYSLLHIAQQYLMTKPILIDLGLFWTSNYQTSQEEQEKYAQMYHSDHCSVKWLKFFIYFKDIDTNSGPHCIVSKTHGRKPKYYRIMRRYSDEELKRYYPEKDFVEFTGEEGTIFAVDTKNFHKGKPIVNNDRLMTDILFANCYFGQGTGIDKVHINEKFSDNFKQMVKTYNTTYPRHKFIYS